MPGPAQFAFMLAFNRSLTEAERDSIATQVAVENPGASPKELMAAKHAFKLKAGLEALKRKSHDEVDSSLSLFLRQEWRQQAARIISLSFLLSQEKTTKKLFPLLE